MSISHVVSWYDLGNPISWAIYLSIAIEIFALASVAASSIKMGRGSIWFLFGLVTFIQILGNIFYEFRDIDPNGSNFLSWVSLIEPIFEDWNIIDHRRLLAAIQGGTLPLMSLTALHFYIQFNDKLKNEDTEERKAKRVKAPTPDSSISQEKSNIDYPIGIDAEAEIMKNDNQQVQNTSSKHKTINKVNGEVKEDKKEENNTDNTNKKEYIIKKDRRIAKDRPDKNWGNK